MLRRIEHVQPEAFAGEQRVRLAGQRRDGERAHVAGRRAGAESVAGPERSVRAPACWAVMAQRDERRMRRSMVAAKRTAPRCARAWTTTRRYSATTAVLRSPCGCVPTRSPAACAAP